MSAAKAQPTNDEETRPIVGNLQFPWRLHRMLNESSPDAGNFEHVVAWIYDGKAFCVRDKGTFERDIMPRYFKSRKYKSFQRNLNIWGFVLVRPGTDNTSHGYRHEHFIRGKPNLCCLMTRSAVKSSVPDVSQTSVDPALSGQGTADAAATDIQLQQHVSSSAAPSNKPASSSARALSATPTTFVPLTSVENIDAVARKRPRADRSELPSHQPHRPSSERASRASATVSAAAQGAASYTNAMARKAHQAAMSAVDEGSKAAAPSADDRKQQERAITFPAKLHRLLSSPSAHSSIAWMPHGRSFYIVDVVSLTTDILPRHFGLSTITDFVAELLKFGFTFIMDGPLRGSIHHELMIQGYQHLLRYMSTPNDAARWTPDREHDPLFATTNGDQMISLQTMDRALAEGLQDGREYDNEKFIAIAKIVAGSLLQIQARMSLSNPTISTPALSSAVSNLASLAPAGQVQPSHSLLGALHATNTPPEYRYGQDALNVPRQNDDASSSGAAVSSRPPLSAGLQDDPMPGVSSNGHEALLDTTSNAARRSPLNGSSSGSDIAQTFPISHSVLGYPQLRMVLQAQHLLDRQQQQQHLHSLAFSPGTSAYLNAAYAQTAPPMSIHNRASYLRRASTHENASTVAAPNSLTDRTAQQQAFLQTLLGISPSRPPEAVGDADDQSS